ncbi:MAG: trigger factor [Lachnospiraceae bacterium]|nr:trigger factor [Lachnospiraceae bacterium]
MGVKDLKKLEDGSVSYVVTKEGADWQAALNKVSVEMQKQKPIQGYRPGKASPEITYQTYGKPMIDQAVTEVLADAMTEVCAEHDYFPVSNQNIQLDQADLKALNATVSFAIYPEIDDFDYTAMEVEKPVKPVTEQDVDDAINRYMKARPWVHEVERAAQIGDVVEASFNGTCEGQPFEYDHSDKTRFIMGRETLFTGLDEKLVGYSAGDDLDVSLTMPANFRRESIAGKTLDLHVHLISVNARDVLECTDEFVKEKVKDCDTVAAFREKQRARLQKQNDQKSDRAFERNIQDALVSHVTCPIPESMISVGVNNYVRALQQMSMQQGISVSQLLKQEGKTLADFKREVRPSAVKQVKVSIALDYVMRKEQFEVPKDAVEKQVNTYMKRARKSSYEAALKALGGEEEVEEKLKNDMAIDFVRTHCKVVEVEVDSFTSKPAATSTT